MKKSLRSLAALILPLCLAVKPINAQDINLLPPKAIEYSIENASPSLEVQNILQEVKTGVIDSYPDLVSNSKDLSEKQKLEILSLISKSSYKGGYSITDNEVLSQESFFGKIQNTLNNNKDKIGVCRHIASNLEQLANDLGLRTAAVSGIYSNIGHAYDISKTENGTAVWENGKIFQVKTKNIEKTLEAYQQSINSMAFQHLFFEDSQLKYKLITEDGRALLNFMEYDESSKKIKDFIFNDKSEIKANNITLETGKKYLFVKGDYSGISSKIGKIDTNLDSPLILINADYKREFTNNSFSIIPEVSVITGVDQKGGISAGGFADITLGTKNPKGFNFSSRTAANCFNFLENGTSAFWDVSNWESISYKQLFKNGFILEPYLIGQLSVDYKDLGTLQFAIKPKELEAGVKFGFPSSKKLELLFNPYYNIKAYESELGAEAELKNKNLNMNIGGYFAKSSYDFAPDRMGIKIGTSLSLNNSKLELAYKADAKNYNGEKTISPSFLINGVIKLK
jgi:hypothetical protein